ncbi:MAG TPA: DUF799 domain-containing protein [Burkholderiaceae bacterium]|nr:DUF799 domain-containing protein [Burkholderiaceae bacterium]
MTPTLVRVGRYARVLGAVSMLMLLAACAATPYDYTAFKKSRPTSMLILPPVNESPDIKATPAVLAQATLPLAEAGYYVLPVTLVDDTFRENGVTTPADIHELPLPKLREIFGADAAVYLRVKKYGTSFQLISSETLVVVEGRIVDLRTGALLWNGSAAASSNEGQSSNQGGLVGMLVKAVINQIVNTTTDASFKYANLANQRLLGGGRVNGVLYGPRSPNYQKDQQPN